MTLTSWLLLVTFCSLLVALWMKLFEHKPFDAKAVLEFGILNGISIGLLNLGLGFNSVGFYQTTKLGIIPYTILLETLYFRKQFRTLSLSGIAGSIVYHWSQPNMKTSVKIIHARNLGSHKVVLIVLDGCVGKSLVAMHS